MRVRILHVTLRSGTRATSEQRLEVDALKVGRGTDNHLRLSGLAVPLRHSELSRSSEGIRLALVEAREVDLNGQQVQGRALRVGDVLRIVQHRLRVLPASAEEDLVLQVDQVEAAPAPKLADRARIGIERGLLTRGTLSVAGGVAVVWLFLVLPFVADGPGPGASGLPARIASTGWTSGPLSRPHSNISDCSACHAAPFAPVRDSACRACHETTATHVPPSAHVDALAATPCTTCHSEHRGQAGRILVADALCTGCHADLGRLRPQTRLANVSSFAAGHPEFRHRRERSGITFSHRRHLATDLRTPVGVVTLECGACHVPDGTGALMRPVGFRDHCQPCHRLAFADADPRREAPHAEPEVVERAIFEFFSARALAGDRGDATSLPRRWAGREPTEPERLQALAWAGERTAEALADLLGERGVCAQCHTLARSEGLPRVAPVSLLRREPLERRLSLASFGHRAHERLPCARCHPAAADEGGSTATMLPGIARCRQCHARARRAKRTLSDCVLCHRFHFCRPPSGAAPRVAAGYDLVCP